MRSWERPSFVARAPAPPLDALVSVVWVFRGSPSAEFEWVLPSGGCQLVVQLDDQPNRWTTPPHGAQSTGPAALGGPFLSPVGLRREDQRSVAGAGFHPGGAAAWLGIPVRPLAGQYVDLLELLGPESERWITRVREARGPREALSALERGLAATVTRRSRRWALAWACERLREGSRVADVAAELGASQRRFSRTFTDETGLTPKQYTRVSRFQRALGLLRREGAGDLAGVALRCGFYDQAHLNHEFRSVAGMTPTAYLARRGPFENHVQVSTSDAQRNRKPWRRR